MSTSRGAPDWGVGEYERTAQVLLPAAQVLVEAAAPQPGERVLDVGAGTGSVALLAARAGAQVTAVDPSPRLLSVAQEAARAEGVTLACEVGDAAALPAADRSVDCLLSGFGIVFAPDVEAAARELARVLGAGGRAAFTAWLPGNGMSAFAAALQEAVLAAAGAPPPAPGFPWSDEAAVADLLAPHGLAVTATGVHELPFRGPSPEEFVDAELATHPLAVAMRPVLERSGQAQQVRDRLVEVLLAHNEEPDAFRTTSRYAVLVARRR